MLLNDRGDALVGKRIDMTSDAWQMPQGGIDDGEQPEQALWRELHEEVGTDKAVVIARAREWLTYEFPPDLQPKLWRGRYRGQAQLWFLLRFQGTDADVDLDKHTDREFSEVQWVEPRHLPDLIVGFKRELYERVLAEFVDHLKLPAPR